MSCALCVKHKKSLLKSQIVSRIYISKRCIVVYLTYVLVLHSVRLKSVFLSVSTCSSALSGRGSHSFIGLLLPRLQNLGIFVQVYCWVLCSTASIYITLPSTISNSLHYYSSIVSLNIGGYGSSHFVLLCQDCFSYDRAVSFHTNFWIGFFESTKKTLLIFW